MKILIEYKHLDGVLHYFYKKDNNYYNNELTIKDDSNWVGINYKEDAFDFSTSSFWTSSKDCAPNPWISFCFKNHQVFLTSFEIVTTALTCRPRVFLFGGSNDDKSYSFQSYEVTMGPNASVHEEFPSNQSDYFKCFKYIGTQNTAELCTPSGYRTDILQIEIFGILREYRNQNHCLIFKKCLILKESLIYISSLFLS